MEDIREYYGNHYKADRAIDEISDLRQIVTIQKYLNKLDRLNVYVRIMNHHLIDIILNSITPGLRQGMAHDEDLL